MKHPTTGTGSDPEKWQLREMNEALLLSSIRQHEMTEQAERAAAALHESEARLMREAAARVLLNQLSSRLWRMPGMRDGLDQVLESVLELLGAEKGYVQRFDAERGVLRIVAHRGFDKPFLDFFSEVSLQDDSACGRALRTGERVLIEDTEADPAYAPYLSITTAAGFRAVQSTPLVARDGTILGVLSTHFRSVQTLTGQKFRWLDLYLRQATDFIERKLIEDRQRDSERHKDEFLAILAHELRNPLGPIRNAAHYLRLKEVGPDLSPPLEMIERQVRHMVRLIDDLLDVSRISRGALELRLEQVRFVEVVEAAIDACSMEIQERRHTLHVNLPKRAVLLRGDRARLIQILCNLITNAAKFTSPGGVIELNATTTGGTLVLRVIDNGLGIPPGKLNAIFELFTQVDRSLERQGGLGIGLTLVRQLIELHGGSINAKSDGVGCGSEFILTLPITAADAASAGVSASPARVRSSKPRRILVADDNHDAAKSLTLLLRQGGHDVYTAFDGMEAVLSAQEYRPELVILDIGMPKMNGYDVARRIRGQPWAKGICLVALTGWGQEADRNRARESGFDAHLVKPVDLDAINGLLATL